MHRTRRQCSERSPSAAMLGSSTCHSCFCSFAAINTGSRPSAVLGFLCGVALGDQVWQMASKSASEPVAQAEMPKPEGAEGTPKAAASAAEGEGPATPASAEPLQVQPGAPASTPKSTAVSGSAAKQADDGPPPFPEDDLFKVYAKRMRRHEAANKYETPMQGVWAEEPAREEQPHDFHEQSLLYPPTRGYAARHPEVRYGVEVGTQTMLSYPPPVKMQSPLAECERFEDWSWQLRLAVAGDLAEDGDAGNSDPDVQRHATWRLACIQHERLKMQQGIKKDTPLREESREQAAESDDEADLEEKAYSWAKEIYAAAHRRGAAGVWQILTLAEARLKEEKAKAAKARLEGLAVAELGDDGAPKPVGAQGLQVPQQEAAPAPKEAAGASGQAGASTTPTSELLFLPPSQPGPFPRHAEASTYKREMHSPGKDTHDEEDSQWPQQQQAGKPHQGKGGKKGLKGKAKGGSKQNDARSEARSKTVATLLRYGGWDGHFFQKMVEFPGIDEEISWWATLAQISEEIQVPMATILEDLFGNTDGVLRFVLYAQMSEPTEDAQIWIGAYPKDSHYTDDRARVLVYEKGRQRESKGTDEIVQLAQKVAKARGQNIFDQPPKRQGPAVRGTWEKERPAHKQGVKATDEDALPTPAKKRRTDYDKKSSLAEHESCEEGRSRQTGHDKDKDRRRGDRHHGSSKKAPKHRHGGKKEKHDHGRQPKKGEKDRGHKSKSKTRRESRGLASRGKSTEKHKAEKGSRREASTCSSSSGSYSGSSSSSEV